MNEKDVRLTYRFLGHAGETEIRILDPAGKKPARNIFVHDEDSFVRVCSDYDGEMNVYVGINEREPLGTKSEDVNSLNAIIFDVDSVHPKDQPATAGERENAYFVAEEIMEWLKGFNRKPFLAMSGNGWQIWLKMDVSLGPNKKKVEAVIQDLHREISKRFSTPDAKIDNIGDLGRVIKVIGTTSLKSKPSDERPNLVSYWVRKPIFVKPHDVWAEKLLKMARERKDDNSPSCVVGDVPQLTEQQMDGIINGMNPFAKGIFFGTTDTRYKSKSEEEFALLISMARSGIPIEMAYAIMFRSKTGKWSAENETYRKLTITKAYNLAKTT